MAEFRTYAVWDAPTRWFHWINLVCVLVLIGVGLVIMNASALGVPNPGKIALKTVHVYAGYVFAANLLIRLIWAFAGNRFARWRALLPGGRDYLARLRAYVAALRGGAPQPYLGHNPLGRIAVTLLLALLLMQAVTGLVLAGTDLFLPPLGGWIAHWIAAAGVDPAALMPYAKDMYDAGAYADMRAFRKPFIELHEFGFYALAGLGALHIAAVIATEIREGGTLVSAMFSGRKVLEGEPVDRDG